jgi:hypothetical protein
MSIKNLTGLKLKMLSNNPTGLKLKMSINNPTGLKLETVKQKPNRTQAMIGTPLC